MFALEFVLTNLPCRSNYGIARKFVRVIVYSHAKHIVQYSTNRRKTEARIGQLDISHLTKKWETCYSRWINGETNV